MNATTIINDIKANITHAEAKLTNFSRQDLCKIAKVAGCYGGNSRAVKSKLVTIIADHLAALPIVEDADIKRKEELKEVLQYLSMTDLKKKIAGYGITRLIEVKNFKKNKLVDYLVDLEMKAKPKAAAVGEAFEVEVKEVLQEKEAVEAQEIKEDTVLITVGEQITPPTPQELPQGLQALYEQTTPQERAAFDSLLATATNKQTLSKTRKTVMLDKKVQMVARKKAGCTRLDAAIFWLFEENAQQGYTVEELAQRWQLFSGEENKEYQVKMFNWYFADFKVGGHNRKAIKGWKVIFKQVDEREGQPAYVVDFERTNKSSANAYKIQAAKIQAKAEKTTWLKNLTAQATELPLLAAKRAKEEAQATAEA